ncbi:discoidin domain-containing protein, partial [Flavihumibacter sediminis]|nr:discoidin domain-containing protein [Flavihumibacter sediminis]
EPVTFNIIRIRENIQLGQRIERIAIDVKENDNWKEVAQATSIGANRLVRLPSFLTTHQLRLRILQSPVSIALSDIGIFKEPDELPSVSYGNVVATGAMDKRGWKVVSASSESKDPKGAALHAIDNDPSTLWYTWNNEREMSPPPQEIVVDMGKAQTIKAFTYLPRTGGSWGVVGQYEWQVSPDGKT